MSISCTRSQSPSSHQMPFPCRTLELSNAASTAVMRAASPGTAHFYFLPIPAIVSSYGEPIVSGTLNQPECLPWSSVVMIPAIASETRLGKQNSFWETAIFFLLSLFSLYLCPPQLELRKGLSSVQCPCNSSMPCYFPRDNMLFP